MKTHLKFSLRSLLIQSILVAVAFAIVFGRGQTLTAHIVASAVYSVGFAVTSNRHQCVRNGFFGAVLGWAVSLVLAVGLDFGGDLMAVSDAPYFDGDGPLHGLIIAPLFAFFYLLIPVAIMGCAIGFLSLFIRSRIVPRKGTNE